MTLKMPIDKNLRLLLLSTSTIHGGQYLGYAESEIRDFFGPIRKLLFVPYALADRDGYAKLARERFEKIGITVSSLHAALDLKKAIADTEALFVGGGNTFRLIKALHETGAL